MTLDAPDRVQQTTVPGDRAVSDAPDHGTPPRPWAAPGSTPATTPTGDPADPPADHSGGSAPAAAASPWGQAAPAPGWGVPAAGGTSYDASAGTAPGRQDASGRTGYGAQVPAWSPSARPRPGVVPLRPVGVGEILDGAVQTIRRNPRVMLGLSAVVLGIAGVVVTIAQAVGLSGLVSGSTAGSSEVADGVVATGAVAGAIVPALVMVVSTTVLTGLLIVAVSDAVLGRRPTAREVWARARSRVWALLGLTALLAVGAVLLVAVAIAPGVVVAVSGSTGLGVGIAVAGGLLAVLVVVFVGVRLAFAAPAMLLERGTVAGSLRRSWQLVRGTWWRVFGILLLASVISSFVQSLLQTPFTILSLAAGGLGGAGGLSEGASLALVLLVGNIGTVVSAVVASPFAAAVTALLYIDVRMRREGLDVELLRAAEADARATPRDW